MATIDQGTNNALTHQLDDLGMNLDEAYTTHQLARTLDFRDNQSTEGVGATHRVGVSK